MKRKFILLPVTLTTLAPVISLVGCGDPDTPEEEAKFTTTTGEMSSETEATFDLDWANGHRLTFGANWEFTTNVGSVQSVTATGGDTRPQTISITFSTEITTTDITDGKLTFTYNDLTTKKDNISITIENICITKYSPEPTPPKYDYLCELDAFHNDSYGRDFCYFYPSKESLEGLEKDKTYLFRTNLGIIDETTFDWFFDGNGWLFSISWGLDLGNDIDFEVWINDTKQNKQEEVTEEKGTNDFVVNIESYIEFCGYHSSTPPIYGSIFDIYITPHFVIGDTLSAPVFKFQ